MISDFFLFQNKKKLFIFFFLFQNKKKRFIFFFLFQNKKKCSFFPFFFRAKKKCSFFSFFFITKKTVHFWSYLKNYQLLCLLEIFEQSDVHLSERIESLNIMGALMSTPLKPFQQSNHSRIERFKGGPQLSPMMPRGASLLVADVSFFSILQLHGAYFYSQ